MQSSLLGIDLNGHAVAIILKELVRRAIVTIRAERQAFEVMQKQGYADAMDDIFTSADKKAQEIFLKSLRECFPGITICAEEAPYNIAVPETCATFFTVDPLDGTKAFVRRQSHGVGSMAALIVDNRVVSAYVGDVNTQEIYGYRPGGGKVSRITGYESAEELGRFGTISALEGCVLLRELPDKHSTQTRRIISHFRKVDVESGSIGTWMARLWKGEVSAAVLPPGKDTPWDSNPIYGICEALGYRFWKPIGAAGFEEWRPGPVRTVVDRDHDLLVIHQNDFRNGRFV